MPWRPRHRRWAQWAVSKLGFSNEHRARVMNHKRGGVTDDYSRHDKLEQKRRALDAWGNHLMAVVERRAVESAVVQFRSGKGVSA